MHNARPVELVKISRRLSRAVSKLDFPSPVTHVYNPLVYARDPHEQWLERYGPGTGRAVMLGMNPGPFGMAQTGVPFGEVGFVRDWLKIEGKVGKPKHEHEKRPVVGFDCTRSEVSGSRVWGWAKERFKTPKRFLSRYFIVNYCPLVFMEETGRNFIPEKLPKEVRAQLFEACDRALIDTVAALQPRLVIGIGAFAKKRAQKVLGDSVPIGTILHPSPASPMANRGWAPQAEAQLRELGETL